MWDSPFLLHNAILTEVGRRLGQHFLHRRSILDRIAAAACGNGAPLIIEIGPGRGALTEPLLARSERVVAIEVDPVLIHYLQQKFQNQIAEGRLAVIDADVLKTDLGGWGKCAIAGNLPYYITSPILERIFAARGCWDRAILMVQAEVAARLIATPQRASDYGYLSVATQVRARVDRLLDVPRDAFRPPPKVDSAVVSLVPRDPTKDFAIENVDEFLTFAGLCFRHKRKTLRNNLIGAYPKGLVARLVEPKARAEELGIPELARLFQAFRAGL